MKSFLTLLIFFLFVVPSASSAQQQREKLFNNYIQEYIKNKKVPSISAGVLRDDKIVWLGAKGLIDLENVDSANVNSLYRIASITKPITAVAIMQLFERGLINIDEDVRKYVPSFPAKKWKLSIRQLLNHTSGVRNYKDGEFHSKKFYSNSIEAIKVFAYDSLLFEPGTKYEYTSLGYSLLAAVIENVTNKSFEEYLINNIFIPVGMKNTHVDKQRKIIPNRVKGYKKGPDRNFENAPLADLSIKIAGGGIISTAEDLLLFASALLNEKLLKRSTMDLMFTKSKLKNGRLLSYGLGFDLLFSNDSLKTIAHSGGGTGFSSRLLIYPDKKLAAVNLINIIDRNLGVPSEDLVKIELELKVIMPTKTLSDDLMTIYLSAGIDSAISVYKQIYQYQTVFYTLNETESIYFAKDLIELNKATDAIKYLKLVLTKYPRSFDSEVTIAEAYLQDQNKGLALKHYRQALQINPNDSKVNRIITQLSKK
jgi:CubicO group peptidase (beta-lactamase class C family)